MTRPTVLIATTQPAMAYALGARLKEPCRELGLRLEVCPEGEGHDISGETVCVYDSAESLFDYLEKQPPLELADTLVVLDLGTELEDAFLPGASTGTATWRPSKHKMAGVAVELLLRFPQVFPVFLSPAVPVVDADKKGVIKPVSPTTSESNNWSGFHRLRKALCVRYGPTGTKKLELELQSLPALQVPLHFVAPLDEGAGLVSTLTRFSDGMRCWFDPTGLRTLVRNRFLGTLFGDLLDWSNTWPSDGKNPSLRLTLLGRLDRVALAVDEEREFALVSAYAAYKFGYRAWMVTTYTDFKDSSLRQPTKKHSVVLRDIDLRFPDIGDEKNVRADLKDIHSDKWKDCLTNYDSWRVRVVSSDPRVKQDETIANSKTDATSGEASKLGQFGTGENITGYLGLKKPISALYDLRDLLGDRAVSVAAKLGCQNGGTQSASHGAPYQNLPIAESLLRQAARCSLGPTENLIGAFLAGEAFQLLLGMSKTTCLEALLLQHKHEVMAEGDFPGMAHAGSIEARKIDVNETLRSLLPADSGEEKASDLFKVKFWAELKVAYRNNEQFVSAEEANAQSLLHGSWGPLSCNAKHGGLLGSISTFFGVSIFPVWRRRIKGWAVNAATSFRAWAIANVLLALFATGLYGLLTLTQGKEGCCLSQSSQDCCPDTLNYFDVFLSVALSTVTLQPMTIVQKLVDGCPQWGTVAAIIHILIAYILFGILISMLYRKVTRG